MSESPIILRVADLHKKYGDSKLAVKGVSFDIRQGEIVGLLGPNGAGKTTTINMLLGVLEPTKGSIHVMNMDLSKQRTRALEQINFCAVYAPLPGNMSVWQNLKIFGMMYAIDNVEDRVNTLLDKYDLRRIKDTKCGVLSSGEQTRVALAKAFLNKPKLLLLDEPTASLDPSIARDIRQAIKDFVAEGTSAVLWTSHNMYEVQDVCDRVMFLANGKILLEGDPRALPAQHGKESLEDLFVAVAHQSLEERDAA